MYYDNNYYIYMYIHVLYIVYTKYNTMEKTIGNYLFYFTVLCMNKIQRMSMDIHY